MASIIYSFADTKRSHRIQQCAELFPLELRGMGSAILAGGVWAANIVISATFLTIMEHVGAAGAFGIYAGICAVSVQTYLSTGITRLTHPLLIIPTTARFRLYLLLLPRSQRSFFGRSPRMLQARIRDPQVQGDQGRSQAGLQGARRTGRPRSTLKHSSGFLQGPGRRYYRWIVGLGSNGEGKYCIAVTIGIGKLLCELVV
jgi:hypothetical protein